MEIHVRIEIWYVSSHLIHSHVRHVGITNFREVYISKWHIRLSIHREFCGELQSARYV
jgi:hypothetical protein